MGVDDNNSGGGKDKGKGIATTKEGLFMSFQVSMLNSTNYTVWAIHMKAIFNVHQVWDVIEPCTTDAKKGELPIHSNNKLSKTQSRSTNAEIA